MVGMVAEQLLGEGTDNSTGGLEDLRQLRSAVAHLPNPAMHERWALLRARNLLGDRRDLLAALAVKMRQNASVEECCQLIDRYQSIDKNLDLIRVS
jgi:hypothetical protein